MVVCASCGAENREGARFCDSCGAPLVEAVPPREVRKVVTVLFCDVTGSTALGERIDPESLRRVMSRYFETAKTVVERHGGTVEKFIGDAVMAVFGVPTVHEDDALRAVRAASELRGGLADLNDELQASYGTRLELRIGVNTGEVVTGTEERLATGDAVNVAARLEQAAEPGEILLGEETYRLARDAVDCEPAEPIQAKGKAEAPQAYRLRSVREPAERRHEAPMVGRKRQRKLLEDAFATASAERACHLFTILGAAGVGKSRLAEEFLRTLSDTAVVRGRCLSYGEGISYWPVTEVVKQLVPEGTTGPLASILGDESAASTPEEIAWAFRKLLESRASDQPLVVVFDDLQWGQPAFLDLVEHVADLSRGASILLLCMARPDLLDVRPAWGGGKLNAANVLLEPLGDDEAHELLDALTEGIAADLRERILEAAGGNPLFVEEMVAMAVEEGGEVAVPPTIQALLAARLDQLEPAERGVLERGAVEGLVFHRGAVAALAPEEREVDGRLVTLVRKDLVRPEMPVFVGDDAYRFRHLLIRDTAYDALPKAVRAQLHERFALWLEEHGADLVELDEIVGYHLEQAYRYRVELGPPDEESAVIAARAAKHLYRGAERAGQRGDFLATSGLLSRVLELQLPDDRLVRWAQLDLAVAFADLGDFARGAKLREEAVSAARAAGDERLLARAELARLEADIQANPTATIKEALAGTQRALAELERLGDEEGAVWALRLLANFTAWIGKGSESMLLLERALARAERVSPRRVSEALMWMTWEIWWGFTPTDEGIRRCDEMVEQRLGSKALEAFARMMGGTQKAARGLLESGRDDVAAGRQLLRELNNVIWWAGTSMVEGDMELSTGDPEIAYAVLAEGSDALSRHAETGYLATVFGLRAQAALRLGREDEALQLASRAEQLAQHDDFEPHARQRLVRAGVLMRRGETATSAELVGEAAAIIAQTDYYILHRDLAFTEAEVERSAGRAEGERRALERALSNAEQKADLVAADRARQRLAEL